MLGEAPTLSVATNFTSLDLSVGFEEKFHDEKFRTLIMLPSEETHGGLKTVSPCRL